MELRYPRHQAPRHHSAGALHSGWGDAAVPGASRVEGGWLSPCAPQARKPLGGRHG